MARRRTWSDVRGLASRTFAPYDDVAGEATGHLLAWCQSKGMPPPQAHPFPFPAHLGGHGLAASKDLQPGEVVLTVPRPVWEPHSANTCLQHALTKAPAMLQRMNGALPETIPEDMHDKLELVASLSMHILINGHEIYPRWLQVTQGPDSYVDGLPPFWPEERFEMFQASRAGVNVKKFVGFADALHSALFGRDNSETAEDEIPADAPPAKLLKWALTVVQSRAVSGKGFPFTMVPYFDLLNHSSTPNCHHSFDHDQGAFQVVATREILANEQCFISYGDLSNVMLLKKYGFVQEDNPFDDMILERFNLNDFLVATLEEDKPDGTLHTAELNLKEKLMTTFGPLVRVEDLFISKRRPMLSDKMRHFLRASCVTLVDVLTKMRNDGGQGPARFFVSPLEEEKLQTMTVDEMSTMVDLSRPLALPESEVKCFQKELEIIKLHQEAYTTTLEEDQTELVRLQALGAEHPDNWKAKTLTILVAEKTILRDARTRLEGLIDGMKAVLEP